MFDPITILAGLLPLGVEAGKALIQRYIAPYQIKPLDFGQLIQLKQLELQQWQAMQGNGAQSYQWVAAIRQLQRPIFVACVAGAWCWQTASGEPSATVANMASAVGFYLFGDRTLFYIKGKP